MHPRASGTVRRAGASITRSATWARKKAFGEIPDESSVAKTQRSSGTPLRRKWLGMCAENEVSGIVRYQRVRERKIEREEKGGRVRDVPWDRFECVERVACCVGRRWRPPPPHSPALGYVRPSFPRPVSLSPPFSASSCRKRSAGRETEAGDR